MPNTLGYHYVKTTYGMWLPGDARGHWSSNWDAMIGFHDPHQLNDGDAARQRLASARMKHAPVRLTHEMMILVEREIARCQSESEWHIVAASIEPTHMHLLFEHFDSPIEKTTTWIAQRITKAIHSEADHEGPVWAKGSWCNHIFDESHWNNTVRYIEQHNNRRGEGPRPYSFLRKV
jgi:REP element-mobilizing transposase RayT